MGAMREWSSPKSGLVEITNACRWLGSTDVGYIVAVKFLMSANGQ